MKRRDFVKAASVGAAGVGASAIGLDAVAETLEKVSVAPSDNVTVGVIGVGSRGKHMMRRLLRVPGVRIGALCDVYEPRFTEGREITGEETPVYRDYHSMLKEVKDLDAVLVASPLSFHGEHMVAALDGGLHVYGEKAMGFTVSDCNAIVEAVKRNRRWFQIGLQYRYAPWYRQAIRRIAEGEIGRVTHVYGYWHRNYNWRRPLPEPSLERLINWRLYREYSGGLLAELGSHHLDVANWIFGEHPARVLGDGGIDFYHDGRETYDNVQAVYTYPSGGKFFFSSIIGNHKFGYQIHVYGTGGTVELTLQDGAFYYEPARPNSAVPKEVLARGVDTKSSLSTEGDMPYRGPGSEIEVPEDEAGDPTLLACASFIESLRQDKQPFADENVGWAAAVPVALGNEAAYEKGRVDIAERRKEAVYQLP
jgi:predicted dehydrogenase